MQKHLKMKKEGQIKNQKPSARQEPLVKFLGNAATEQWEWLSIQMSRSFNLSATAMKNLLCPEPTMAVVNRFFIMYARPPCPHFTPTKLGIFCKFLRNFWLEVLKQVLMQNGFCNMGRSERNKKPS